MAKPSSVASSAPSATRSTRATRSTSEQPPASTAPPAKGRQPVPKKTRGRKPKTATTELTTVTEDAAIDNQLQNEIIAAEAITVDDMEGVRRTSAAPSHVSATTAKTSFSQEEIADLDPTDMVDVLPSMAFSAEGFAKLLVPIDPKKRQVVRKEIRLADSKHNKSYSNRIAEMLLHKAKFGSQEYIQPSIVLRALLGVKTMSEVPEGIWRPDSVIYKINLAQMLNCVLVLTPDMDRMTEAGKSAIENLNVHFASAIAGPVFSQNALGLQLALLIQLSIIYLAESASHPEFDAGKIIMSVFYGPDEDGEIVFHYGNVLHMMNLPDAQAAAFTDEISQVVNEVRDTFDSGRNVMAGLAALRTQFPWESFVEHVIQYYLERELELDQQIAAAGGVKQIVNSLTEEVQRREDARVAEAKRETFALPRGTPKKAFGGKGSIRALQAREKRVAADAAALPTPDATLAVPTAQMIQPDLIESQPVQPIAVPDDDGFNRLEDDDRPAQQTQAQSTAHAVLSNLQATQRQNAAKGKGRLFADRQEGAVRVNFDDSSQSQLTDYRVPSNFQYPASSAREQGPYYESPRRTTAKRAHEEDEPEDFEPTQDQGFQTDTRDIAAAADQRRREAPQVQPRIVPQGRFSSAPRPSAAAAGPSPTPSPKRQRKNPGSSIPAPLAPYDPDGAVGVSVDDRMQRAKLAARHGTITAARRTAKPTQVRTPWDQEEENALIDLIEELGGDGIRYAYLKAMDTQRDRPALGKRSAEDMRFKARNMKETFLKGRSALPRNFKYIVLDKKAIAKLHGLGIEYHQDRIRGGYVEIDAE